MGSTPVYGFPFPENSDPPDVPSDIRDLAEEIEPEILRIDGDITDIASMASKGTVLGEINPTGGSQGASTFAGIDQSYSSLMLIWRGRQSGADSFERLSMRFNSDNGSNYTRLMIRTATDSGSFDPDITLLGTGTFTTAHAGSVGSGTSNGVVFFNQPLSSTTVSIVGVGMASRGGVQNVAPYVAGSRWNNASTITSVAAWPGAQLWEGTCRLILVGFRG